jgi:hypothetical protein
MYLDKNPWLVEPSAMSLAWTFENMSKPAKQVIRRDIIVLLPPGMYYPQERKRTIDHKVI